MSLIDDFKTRFPEFETATVDSKWSDLESLWPNMYGATYDSGTDKDDSAILYLVAHLLKVSQGSSPAMASSSKSVGSVSVTHVLDANMGDRKSFFNSTKYGQMFLMLTRFRHGSVFI